MTHILDTTDWQYPHANTDLAFDAHEKVKAPHPIRVLGRDHAAHAAAALTSDGSHYTDPDEDTESEDEIAGLPALKQGVLGGLGLGF